MECLGIPVDHRLRRLIRNSRPIHVNAENSDHIRILHEFGTSLKLGTSDYLAPYDLSFGIELARPATKGGVLVVLQQPYSRQDNSGGFMAGKRNCATIKAVSELISVASNEWLGLDDVSIFDAIPFLDETMEDESLIEKAHGVFADMAKAKQPEVVLCCFQTEAHDEIIRELKSLGVGKYFNPDTQRSKELEKFGLSLTRVNAFHPNYAVNRHPEFSCLKRLLVLEFVKAFLLLQNNWHEDRWMAHLRYTCREEKKETSLSRMQSLSL